MTTINETVQTTLSNAGYGQYQQYAAPVVTALVNREQEIVGRLIQFAERSDLDVSQVREALVGCGMHMPVERAPEPETMQAPMQTGEATPVGAGVEQALVGISNTLAGITATLNGLTEFARRNGYSG